jgi:hypothetical protein
MDERKAFIASTIAAAIAPADRKVPPSFCTAKHTAALKPSRVTDSMHHAVTGLLATRCW